MMGGGPHHGLEDPNLQPMQPVPASINRTLEEHDVLMRSLGLQGTPGIVYRGLDGQLVTRPGIPPEELPLALGAL